MAHNHQQLELLGGWHPLLVSLGLCVHTVYVNSHTYMYMHIKSKVFKVLKQWLWRKWQHGITCDITLTRGRNKKEKKIGNRSSFPTDPVNRPGVHKKRDGVAATGLLTSHFLGWPQLTPRACRQVPSPHSTGDETEG